MGDHVLLGLLLIGIVPRVHGERWIDLGRTRWGHVRRGLWNGVVMVVHRHDVFVQRLLEVLQVTRGETTTALGGQRGCDLCEWWGGVGGGSSEEMKRARLLWQPVFGWSVYII